MPRRGIDTKMLGDAAYIEDFSVPSGAYEDEEDDESYGQAQFVPDPQTVQFMMANMGLGAAAAGQQASAKAEKSDDEVTIGHIIGHDKTKSDEFARAFAIHPEFSAYRDVFNSVGGMDMIKAAAKKGERVTLFVPDNAAMVKIEDGGYNALKLPSKKNVAKNFINAHAALNVPGPSAAARIHAEYRAANEDEYYEDDDESYASAQVPNISVPTLQESGARISVQRDPESESEHAKIVVRRASRERGGKVLAAAKVRQQMKVGGHTIYLISSPLVS